MARGTLVGFDEARLLAIREKAEQAYLEGESVMSYASDGVSVTKRQDVRVHEALAESAYALYKLDPVTYAKFAPAKRFTIIDHGGSASR